MIHSNTCYLNLGARIGFNPINYRVFEIDGFVELVVEVLEGSLGTSYRVQFDTEEIIDFPSAAQGMVKAASHNTQCVHTLSLSPVLQPLGISTAHQLS